MQEAVQEAVAAAFEENVRFDVRANIYTLVRLAACFHTSPCLWCTHADCHCRSPLQIAITGVVIFWRGVWTLW